MCQELCEDDVSSTGEAQAEHKLVSQNILFALCFNGQVLDELDTLTAWILSGAMEDMPVGLLDRLFSTSLFSTLCPFNCPPRSFKLSVVTCATEFLAGPLLSSVASG